MKSGDVTTGERGIAPLFMTNPCQVAVTDLQVSNLEYKAWL
jgi:hypothetical protein